MEPPFSTRRAPSCYTAGLLLLLACYLTISLRALAVVPPVYEDEPWQASVGWKLATQHVFGSDLFSGFHGMECRHYAFVPLHSVLLAAIYEVGGLGLLQTRLEPVAMGLATLLLIYGLGRRLFGRSVGLLAVALLLLLRLTGTTRYQVTGILMLDTARIARYDMVVPVFGLLSLHAYLTATSRSDDRLQVLAGSLAGLAGLSHVYGAFWIVALGLLVISNGTGFRSLAALAAGFAAPWLVYLGYVAGGFADWRGQMLLYAPRFQLFDPPWYWQNRITEPRRYGPGLGPPGWHYLARPGFWLRLVAVPGALFALARRGIAGDRAARAIVIPIAAFVAAFASLLSMKLVNYTVTILPLGMLALAWALVAMWRWAGETGRGWAKVALAAVLVAVAVEGTARIAVLVAAGRTTTPYVDYVAKIRVHVPPESAVLGLHNYWFGLDRYSYLTWLVPIWQVDPARPASVSLDQAMDLAAPDVILIDDRMRDYFAARPLEPVPAGLEAWMERRGLRLQAVVSDGTYGTMQIFAIDR